MQPQGPPDDCYAIDDMMVMMMTMTIYVMVVMTLIAMTMTGQVIPHVYVDNDLL